MCSLGYKNTQPIAMKLILLGKSQVTENNVRKRISTNNYSK